jgi:hypothetical protein
MTMKIVRCISCEGFGWFEDDFTSEAEDCDWCGGVGYVYQNDDKTDSPIPKADFEKVADELEQLEIKRLRELGYQGQAKKPWEQDFRQGKQLGQNPYDSPDNKPDTDEL